MDSNCFAVFRGKEGTSVARLEHNLSEGNVLRQMIRFSIPFILSSIVQNLYGLVDLVVIGQFAGAASLAGVNTSAAYISVITNTAIGFCNGGTVLIGQYLGMNNREKLRKVIGTLCTFIILLAALLAAVTLVFRSGLLRLLQTQPGAWDEAMVYLIVSALGFVFIFGYNVLSSILRGMGESRAPFVFICIACGINVVLDAVLVGAFGLGALGAALATVLAQGISTLLCILYLKRNDFVFDFKLRSLRIDRESLVLLLRVAIPTTLQNCVSVFAFTVLTAVTNTLGVMAAAALAGGQKITLFGILPSIAIGNANAAMCAQNFGADRQDRALHTMKVTWWLTLCVNLVMLSVIELFPAALMHAFGSDPELIRQGVVYLRWCSLDFLFVPFMSALTGYLIGAGRTTLPALISVVSSLALRAPLSWLIGVKLGLGIFGVAVATPIASASVAVFISIYILTGQCRKVQRVIQ